MRYTRIPPLGRDRAETSRGSVGKPHAKSMLRNPAAVGMKGYLRLLVELTSKPLQAKKKNKEKRRKIEENKKKYIPLGNWEMPAPCRGVLTDGCCCTSGLSSTDPDLVMRQDTSMLAKPHGHGDVSKCCPPTNKHRSAQTPFPRGK